MIADGSPWKVVVLAMMTGCARPAIQRSQHHGDLATTKTIDEVPVRGFDVSVETANQKLTGELLAVDQSRVWLMIDGRSFAIPRQQITDIDLELDYGTSRGTTPLTVAGSLSTLSHGLLMIYTLPVWLATGVTFSVVEALKNNVPVKVRDISWLDQYARFPQGLPADWYRRSPRPAAPSLDD